MGIHRGKSGIHFCFSRKRKENKAIVTKNPQKSLGPQNIEKVLFYNGNSTQKVWHTLSCFQRNKKENEAIFTKNQTFSLEPKRLEKMLCYNWNSTEKVWQAFSCFWRNIK